MERGRSPEDGPAPLPRPVSVLRCRRAAVVPHGPEIRRRLFWGSLQLRFLCAADAHDGAANGSRTRGAHLDRAATATSTSTTWSRPTCSSPGKPRPLLRLGIKRWPASDLRLPLRGFRDPRLRSAPGDPGAGFSLTPSPILDSHAYHSTHRDRTAILTATLRHNRCDRPTYLSLVLAMCIAPEERAPKRPFSPGVLAGHPWDRLSRLAASRRSAR